MDEPKVRKPRSDKGVPRVSRTTPVGEESSQSAPIFVRVVLKGLGFEQPLSFGCARHAVENGFHVFFYPSLYDRYRESRREFAISEIVDIEITEARQTYDLRPASTVAPAFDSRPVQLDMTPNQSGKPRIHSVRANLRAAGGGNLIERLAQSSGPVTISAEELGGALGVGASVSGIGDSSG